MGNRHPSIAPYETYAAADGDFAVAVGNDALFGRLCEVIGRPELAEDERFATNAARLEHRDALGAVLDEAFATAPAAEWVAAPRAAGVPAGPINDVRAGLRLRRAARPGARGRDRRRADGAPRVRLRARAAGGARAAAAPGRARRGDPRLASRLDAAPARARPQLLLGRRQVQRPARRRAAT